MNKNAKIVMVTMFKNESRVMRRMLESCAPYIDFWVIQNNGSTDGTDQIVRDFFAENPVPGVLYDVEEGWVGFGWNRDHLLKTCQSIEHGCDWILKMDCDEVLEVDEDFDWTMLDDTTIQAFHIPAVSGTSIYHRAWMWNARLPWRFNHDTCHETIYCENPEIGSAFVAKDLPPSFRQVGYNEGQSWSVPTKFMSDALILEEKMLREGTMLTDLYHFWYIGKSYSDCFKSEHFPLKESQQKEYARRAIYYLEEYVNVMHRYKTTKQAQHIDEMSYMGLILAADAYEFIGEIQAAIVTCEMSEQFAPKRNDHLFALANIYQRLGDFENMYKQTSRMMQPERTNPFPEYCGFIETAMYHDSPTQRVQQLHEIAATNLKKNEYKFDVSAQQTNKNVYEQPLSENVNMNKITEFPLYINRNQKKKLFVVDEFYENPDEVRNFALNLEYKEDLRWYKGLRSTKTFVPHGIKEVFQDIIGENIDFTDDGGYNGVFQITTAKDPQVYHYDVQKWAAMIYLTPNAPIESGTRLHKSKLNGTRHSNELNVDDAFSYGFYDSTKFETVDSAGNIYNRLVIMDAKCIHSAGSYFGQNEHDGRLIHLFFFN